MLSLHIEREHRPAYDIKIRGMVPVHVRPTRNQLRAENAPKIDAVGDLNN